MQKFILILAAIVFVTFDHLYASNVKSGNEVTITEPVSGNLYAAGGKVYINAPVNGDLVCAGGEIRITAPVSADILLGGGEVVISSPIGGDLRLASGKVTLEANVAGDLIIGGGELHVAEGVLIGGDVMIAGGKVIFDGTAGGDIKIAGGEVIFNGKTAGKMDVKGGKIYLNGEVQGHASLAAQDLNIGSNAAFYSNVQYWNEKGDANFDSHLKGSATANYNEDLKFKTRVDRALVQKGFFAFAVFRFVSGILLITLLIAFFSRFFNKNAGHIKENVGRYVGVGSLVLVGTPFASAIAFATVIGIPVGFILLGGYSIALILASALTSVVAAYELKKYLKQDWNNGITGVVAIGFLAAMRLIGVLSMPGKLIVFVATAIAIGAVVMWIRNGGQKADETPDATPAGNQEEPSDIV